MATHWTAYDARIDLPLLLHRGAVTLAYRFARVLPQTAVVEVTVGGRAVDRFECRGGTFVERRVAMDAANPIPASVSFHVDSHDRRNLGLKMDAIAFQTDGHTRISLRGLARWRGALLALLAFGLLRGAGWTRPLAAALVVPWVALGSFGLLLRPWLTHRLLTGIPETLVVFGLIGLVLVRRLLARGAAAGAVRAATALALAAFLARALLVNHPDFYYPDLMTHERLVEVLREAGPRFFLSPNAYLQGHGAWSKPAYGGTSSLPYTPTFHALFVLLPFGDDTILTAFKLVGAVLSTVPLIFLVALAGRLGASRWGALLMLLVPSYTSRLSFALLPALLGHVADMSVVLFLAWQLPRLGEARVWAWGAALLAAAQLTYVSSVVNLGLLFVALILLLLVADRKAGPGRAIRLAAMLLAAGALALLAFYRDFLGMGWDLASRIAARGTAATTRYPVESFFALAYTRTRDFFDGVYPLLSLPGLVVLLWRARERGEDHVKALVAAWLIAYGLLLFLRAKIPDVFRYGHETLFVTPLVCLAAGECLAWLWARGGWRRALAACVVAFLAGQGALWQWRAVAEQLGNAL